MTQPSVPPEETLARIAAIEAEAWLLGDFIANDIRFLCSLAREAVAKQTALSIAMQSGGVDGSHHKAWVIDQMVRALTGCPIVTRTALDYNQKPYEYETQGESEAYQKWVAEHNDGEDGPDTYEWDAGIPP